MTKEVKYLALKEESEARSVVSQLGLSRELKGTHIIQEFVIGKRKTEDLSELEVKLVIKAWESRYCVPLKLIMQEEKNIFVDNLNLIEGEGLEERINRNNVKNIEQYVKTIRA